MGRYLMGVHEIAARLGVSRQRVYQVIDSPTSNFPVPFDEIAAGRLWTVEDVEHWILQYRRGPGRPT